MSIILKGIDLPKEYIAVEIKFYIPDIIHSDNIYINGREMPDQEISALFTAEHLKDIIQIPKDHGRLIDGGALETVFKDMAKCEWNQKASPISWAYAFEDTIDEIHDAPTILEAET